MRGADSKPVAHGHRLGITEREPVGLAIRITERVRVREPVCVAERITERIAQLVTKRITQLLPERITQPDGVAERQSFALAVGQPIAGR